MQDLPLSPKNQTQLLVWGTTGTVFGVGSNKEGKLGINSKSHSVSKPQPIRFPVPTQIKQISCGWGHTLALDYTGSVYSWGYGKNGALGHGDFSSRSKPCRVESIQEKVLAVACGSQHSGFLIESGEVLTCGANPTGQLGIGSRENKSVPTAMIGLEDTAEQIALGVTHTLILTINGEVYATGGNGFGQLGLGHKQNVEIPQKIQELDNAGIQKVACGQHSAALSIRGELYLWGTGTFGVYATPHQVTPMDHPVIDLWVGGCFGLALDESKRLWTWGTNTSGELGTGDYTPKSAPTVVDIVEERRIDRVYCGSAYVFAVPEKLPTEKILTRAGPASSKGKLKIPGQIHTKSVGKSTRRGGHEDSLLVGTSSPYRKSKDSISAAAGPLISTIKRERDYYEDALAKERKEREKVEADFKNALKDIDNVKTELEAIKKEVQTKDDTIESLIREKHELSENLQNVAKTCEEEAAEYKTTKLLLNDKEVELRAVKTEAELAKQNLELLKQEHSKVLDQLDAERRNFAQVSERVEVVQKEIDDFKRINLSLEDKASQLETEKHKKDSELERTKEELARVSKALAESQNKCEIIKAYAEETKRSLDIARNENGEHVLKIEELIKEKIHLANELDSSSLKHQTSLRPAELDEIPEATINQHKAPLLTPTFIPPSEIQSHKTIPRGYLNGKDNSRDLDDKLQGILKKCKAKAKIDNRQKTGFGESNVFKSRWTAKGCDSESKTG